MTDAPNRTTEIAAYLVAVERHLADLPGAIREDLLSDLDTHLAEVAADLAPGTTLRDLLGSPEAYARELRETAEVPKEGAGVRLRRSLREAAAPAARRLRAWSDRYAASTGHADAAELVERLRPGWWVARGALTAVLIVYLLVASQYNTAGYHVFGSLPWTLFTIAAVVFCAWVSLRVGARSREWGRRRRLLTAAFGVGLVLYAFYAFVVVAVPYYWYGDYGYTESSYYVEDDVTDIQVYDEDGNPLTGVYLFDQNGNPLWIGDPHSCAAAPIDPFERETAPADGFATIPPGYEEEVDFDERFPYGYQYPLCAQDQSDEPSAFPEPADGPSDEAMPSEEPTATEGPSEAAASDEPSPTEGN
ncbi:hypothetical protein [Glycomyces sp. NRRL B-16210]|uniref:HAAS signaling domain-containing protein n=1 Tax=Glycomyces sp. NRRL B-16210 TaxID=1463821 RepID=UPI0004C0E89A|nr:hypothetical protein [Glycomyces sp. NRRL B-16210]